MRWADATEISELGRELERVLGEESGVGWGVLTTTLANAALAVGALLVRRVGDPVDAAAVRRAALAGTVDCSLPVPAESARGVDPVTGASLAGYGRRVVAGLVDVLVVGSLWAATFAWAPARRGCPARHPYGRALGRALSFEVLALFAFPLFLSFLWPLWDTRRQALYDKMASTIVVRDAGAALG